ncbi:putative aTP-dependent RNA helicase RhlE [Burkholderia mallei]|nr:putative aTP-dependent RNA helicase RhlE [Burkholderia mallei]
MARQIERERFERQRPLDQFLDVGELLALVRAAQRQRVARRARTPRAADPVHVVFRVERQVEIDDGRQFGDVEAARGDVGRNERFDLAALERVERLHPLALRAVAVNRGRDDAVALDLARKAARADLAVAEHDHLLERAVADQLDDGRLLVAFGDVVDDLRDGRRGRVAARDLDRLRIAQVGRRELLDLGRERRREKQRLTLLRQQVQDALQIGEEAHVEHPVGLVEHEDLHLAEIRGLLLDVIE